jgi:hypothetical protein
VHAFRFLRVACWAHLEGSAGLILAKDSPMILRDLSTRLFIPLPRFTRSRRPPSSRPFPRSIPTVVFLIGTLCVFIF